MLGPSLVLLCSSNKSSVLDICNPNDESDLDVGSLASTYSELGLELAVGVVSGFVGTDRGVLISLLKSSALQFVSGSSLAWLFEGGQCWFELHEEFEFSQSSVVRHQNL